MGFAVVRDWGDDGVTGVTLQSADSTNGDFIPVDGTVVFCMKNRGTAAIVVTIPRVKSSHGFQTSLAISVPSASTRYTPVLDPAHFGTRPRATYGTGAAADMDVAAVRIVGRNEGII